MSFEIRRRSRRRSSDTSRSSTTAPVILGCSIRGMARKMTVTGPRSISSVIGRPMAKATRTGDSSRPSSLSRAPSRLEWIPMRWRAETALGDAYSIRADSIEEHARRRRRGGVFGLDVLGAERELAAGDHAGEAVEDLDVDTLQLARPTTNRGHRLAGHHPHHPVLPADRDALDARPVRVAGRACSRRRRSGRGATRGRPAGARPRPRPRPPDLRGRASDWSWGASGRGSRTSSRSPRQGRTATGRRSRSRPASPRPRRVAEDGRARSPRPSCTSAISASDAIRRRPCCRRRSR